MNVRKVIVINNKRECEKLCTNFFYFKIYIWRNVKGYIQLYMLM